LVDKSLLVPGGYFWTVAPPLWSLLIFYFGAWLLFLKPRRRYPAGLLALAYVGWWAIGWSLPQIWERGQQTKSLDACELTFVDVGHGLSTLVRLPDGRHLLYDAGSFGASAFGVRNVTSVLWERGIEHLDAVVLSHADLVFQSEQSMFPRRCLSRIRRRWRL
jgi:competence protein ComEC